MRNKKFTLPMKYNPGQQKYEPDLEKIKKIGDSLKKSSIKHNSKKGVSEMIGYILLIAIAIVISTFVYQWLNNYIPSQSLKCNTGVSLLMQNYTYDCSTTKELNITIKNNGVFNVSGFFIHGTNSSNFVMDLSNYTLNGLNKGRVTIPPEALNNIAPGQYVGTIPLEFDLPNTIGTINSISIIPVRYQNYSNTNKMITCSDAILNQQISCTS